MGEGTFGFTPPSFFIGGNVSDVCGPNLEKCPNIARPDCARFFSELQQLGRIKARGFLVQRFFQSVPEVCEGATAAALRYIVPAQDELDRELIGKAATMGFLDVLNGIGGTIGTILQTGSTILTGVGTAAGALATVINGSTGGAPGNPVQGPALPPGFMQPQAPAQAMVNGNTSTSGQMAFQMACAADPACTAAIVAALQGGQMAPMMNGSAVMNEDVMLAALGFPPALIMQLKQIPGAIGRILGSPAGQIAVGTGIGTAIGALTTGGGMGAAMGARLPRRIQISDGKGGVREYVSRGRPLLYSGDISAVARVRRVAQRVPKGRRRPRQGPLVISAGGNGTHNVCSKCLTSPCNGGCR